MFGCFFWPQFTIKSNVLIFLEYAYDKLFTDNHYFTFRRFLDQQMVVLDPARTEVFARAIMNAHVFEDLRERTAATTSMSVQP